MTVLDYNLIEFELHCLPLDHILLNRVFGYETVDVDLLGLANAVRAVHRL